MNINVLSWNVCFGCMYADKRSSFDKSSQPLPSICEQLNIERGENVCLGNVSKFIDDSCIDGKSYDFIGLQESANWMEIIRRSSELSKMAYVHNIIKIGGKESDHVSFYDKKKYRVLYVKYGNITGTYDIRPYHIIFLKNNYNDSNYIFINIHNAHNNNKEFLQESLSREFYLGNNLIGLREKNFSNLQNYPITIMPPCFFKENQYKVIFVGDFNDSGQKYFEGLKPFNNIPDEFCYLKSIVVDIQKSVPPITCCVPSYKHRELRNGKLRDDFSFGDYILINSELKYIPGMDHVRIPLINRDARIYPTSNHLPVVSTILESEILFKIGLTDYYIFL